MCRHDGANSMRERSRHSDWHSRPTYPAPCCSDTTRSSHSRRSLAWRTAAWAYLLAPPPWDCQVGCATCCLYAPLYLVSPGGPCVKCVMGLRCRLCNWWVQTGATGLVRESFGWRAARGADTRSQITARPPSNIVHS